MTSLKKSNPKELAYRQGRNDERKKLIRKLETMALGLGKNHESLEPCELAGLVAFNQYILVILKELDAKL